MGNVSFTPHYTLRAVSSGSDSSLNVRYHARIANHSGEDWNDVSLAISTAIPSETTVIPRMMRWTVDFLAPYNQSVFKSKNANLSAPKGGYLVQQQNAIGHASQAAYSNLRACGGAAMDGLEAGFFVDEEVDMVTSAAEVSEGITSTFIIPAKQTIKDGERNHTVVIRDLVLQGKFANICIPKLKPVTYLQVRP